MLKSESIQLLPKTPTDKKQMQQRSTRKYFDDPQLARTCTSKLFNDVHETQLEDSCNRLGTDNVSDEDIPDEAEDDECLPCFHAPLPSAATSLRCTPSPSLDCTCINRFPGLKDRSVI